MSRRSLGWTFLVFLLWLGITIGGNALVSGHVASPVELVTKGVNWAIAADCLFLILVLQLWGWRGIGFRAPVRGSLRLMWLPMLYILGLAVAAAVKGVPDPVTMGFILFNTLLVGFSEEVMCRGILFAGLRDRLPIWPALLIATGIFGGVHVLNGFVTGSFLGSSIQAGAATVTGLVLMALRLRTGSLWPVILYHAAWDFLSFLVVHGKSGPPKAQDLVLTPDQILGLLAVVAVLVLPNGLYALWLLRDIRRRGDPALRPAGAEGV